MRQDFDFFAQELSSENYSVFPPVFVARIIHYLSLQKAMATFVVHYGLLPVPGLY